MADWVEWLGIIYESSKYWRFRLGYYLLTYFGCPFGIFIRLILLHPMNLEYHSNKQRKYKIAE